jgi:hypothetical protein
MAPIYAAIADGEFGADFEYRIMALAGDLFNNLHEVSDLPIARAAWLSKISADLRKGRIALDEGILPEACAAFMQAAGKMNQAACGAAARAI